MQDITTLEQLAAFINAADEWPLEVADIIRSNGWEDLTADGGNICASPEGLVYINDNGEAVVL